MKRHTRMFLLLGSLASFFGVTQVEEMTGSLLPVAEALAYFSPGNCINSLDDLSSLPPLRFSGTAAEGKAVLLAILAAFPEATVRLDEALPVEAIFTTTVGFRDTVWFRIDASGQPIDLRSTSRRHWRACRGAEFGIAAVDGKKRQISVYGSVGLISFVVPAARRKPP